MTELNMRHVSLAGETLVRACHGASKAAGWWQDLQTGEDSVTRPDHKLENRLLDSGKKY